VRNLGGEVCDIGCAAAAPPGDGGGCVGVALHVAVQLHDDIFN
jgi:hypothetical protein